MMPDESFYERLTVSPSADGLVAVTVLLPPELVREYCRFLESLSGFFHLVNQKVKAQHADLTPAAQVERQEEKERFYSDYCARLVKSFDAYTVNGLDRKEAVKRVAADLRTSQHPWCGVDLVRSQLVKLGRGGRSGRPRVQP